MTAPAPALPVLPYHGHSTSPNTPSAETRAWFDAVGITAEHQRAVYTLVSAAGPEGVTVAEIRAAIPWNHHGSLSGALSVLHMKGHLALLVAKRQRCHIYVLPEYVRGRETKPHTSNRRTGEPAAPTSDLDGTTAMLDRAGIPYRLRTVRGPIPTPPGVAPHDPPLAGYFTLLDVWADRQPVPAGPGVTRMVFTTAGALRAVWAV